MRRYHPVELPFFLWGALETDQAGLLEGYRCGGLVIGQQQRCELTEKRQMTDNHNVVLSPGEFIFHLENIIIRRQAGAFEAAVICSDGGGEQLGGLGGTSFAAVPYGIYIQVQGLNECRYFFDVGAAPVGKRPSRVNVFGGGLAVL